MQLAKYLFISTVTWAVNAQSSVYGVSGQITASGAPLNGVTVSLNTGATTITSGTGNYSFTGLAPATYTVTPSLSGYTFNPPNQTATAQLLNFAASPVSSGTNLALGKPTTQSSVLSGYPTSGPGPAAGAAVDRNTDGNYFHGSVTHTGLDADAWWQVDLGGSASISSITIWNRTDCCMDRLSDYWVFVSNTPFSPTDNPSTLQSRAGTWSSHQISYPNPSATLTVNAQGEYVRVQLSGTNYLSLAEVQVTGTIGSVSTSSVISNGMLAQYAMRDAVGAVLPDSSGNGNNGTLVNSPVVGSQGVTFNRGSGQYIVLPAVLNTQVRTIQLFADCDRYAETGTLAAMLGNTTAAGLKIFCGMNSTGNTKYMLTTMGSSSLPSYFSMQSPSLFTVVLDPSSTRILDNATETMYGGFYGASNMGFNMAGNTGQWQLGGDAGEWYNGTIYYTLMYNRELSSAEISQNVTAIQSIMQARGVPARTDGQHTDNVVLCEGTSIEAYGWCQYLGGSLTGVPGPVLVTAQPGGSYNNITQYTVARDGPLTNPLAARNIAIAGGPINDFTGAPLSTVTQNYSTVIGQLKSEGWNQIYCGYMLSAGSTSYGGQKTDYWHDQFNAWLQVNYAAIGCKAVLPWDSRFVADGAYANPNPTACGGSACFSPDGIHPSGAGFAALAALAAAIINAQ